MKAFWSWALHTFEAHQLPGHGFSSLPKFSHKNCLSHRTLLCLHNLLNRHRQGFHLPLIPHLCSPQLFNYSRAALVSSGHSFLLGLCCAPHSSTHTWKNAAARARSQMNREYLRAVGNLHLGCCVYQVSVQSKASTIFSLLPFSFSYLTEVLSPQSLAIGYQLPAEPETKLSLKQRGEKREKSTKESWSQLLLGSPAGSVGRTKARGCCCLCASCHRPAKPPGAHTGTACLQSIPPLPSATLCWPRSCNRSIQKAARGREHRRNTATITGDRRHTTFLWHPTHGKQNPGEHLPPSLSSDLPTTSSCISSTAENAEGAGGIYTAKLPQHKAGPKWL